MLPLGDCGLWIADCGFVLAQAALPALDPGNPVVFLGLLIGGALTLALLFNTVDQIVDRRRRKPPIDAEFARKSDLHATDERLSGDIADVRRHISSSHRAIYERIEEESKQTRAEVSQLGRTLDTEFRTLYRALGKVEGVTLEDPRRG